LGQLLTQERFRRAAEILGAIVAQDAAASHVVDELERLSNRSEVASSEFARSAV